MTREARKQPGTRRTKAISDSPSAELKRIAEKLQPGNSAIIVLFENLWERKFREIAAKYEGTVTNQRLISSEMLVRMGKELRQRRPRDLIFTVKDNQSKRATTRPAHGRTTRFRQRQAEKQEV